MNKYVLFGFLVGFLILMIYMADSVEGVTSGDVALPPTGDVGFNTDTILGILLTFWSIVSFGMEGLPALFSVIFIIISVIVVYMIVDVVKDVIPFT